MSGPLKQSVERTAMQTGAAAMRRIRQAVRRTVAAANRVRRELREQIASPPVSLARRWDRILVRLLKYGGATVGNRVTLYSDGDQAMEALWDAIANAKRRIWFEMYILQADRVGRRTLEELTKAARRGCKVTLLYDGIGSAGLSESALRPLRQAGAEIAVFNPIRLWRWPGSLLRRDHRKIIIVDDKVGFCGGMNISEDYAGKKHGNGLFSDCCVRMEGPCVRDLAGVFVSSWRAAHQPRRRVPRRRRPVGDTFVQVQASRGAHGRRSIQRALRLTIRNAVSHCYITTPYFIPPYRLVRAITRARERGVDVRILTAGVCDVPIVHLAAQHVYGNLLTKGVRIYEMYDSTLHAKTITVDGVYATVGSFNLDTWSDKRNLEVNIAMIEPQIANAVQDLFNRNIESATEVTLDTLHKREWWQRLLHWSAYQLLRL